MVTTNNVSPAKARRTLNYFTMRRHNIDKKYWRYFSELDRLNLEKKEAFKLSRNVVWYCKVCGKKEAVTLKWVSEHPESLDSMDNHICDNCRKQYQLTLIQDWIAELVHVDIEDVAVVNVVEKDLIPRTVQLAINKNFGINRYFDLADAKMQILAVYDQFPEKLKSDLHGWVNLRRNK